jgi:hypothetical protein
VLLVQQVALPIQHIEAVMEATVNLLELEPL